MPGPKCEGCPQTCEQNDGECQQLGKEVIGVKLPEDLDIHVKIALLNQLGQGISLSNIEEL